MSFQLRYFALRASKVSRFPPFRTTPVHSIQPSRISRAFGISRVCQNDEYVPSSIPKARRPSIPALMSTSAGESPPPSPPPPPPPPRRTLRRFLRFVPWKSVIAISIGIYLFYLAETTTKDSIKSVSAQFAVPDNTWIYLNLNDLHITDSPHSERALQLVPFISSSGKRRMTLLEVTETLVAAGMDTRVKGIVLAFNESMIEHRAFLTGEIIESRLGMGALNELCWALQVFVTMKKLQRMEALGQQLSESSRNQSAAEEGSDLDAKIQLVGKVGRFIDLFGMESLAQVSEYCAIAVADNYSSGFDYALARAAEAPIILQPTGSVHLTGLSMQQLFFGKALQKYGVDFKVEARREYKSALASFSGSAWNEPTRENLEDLLWSLQTQTLADLCLRYRLGDPEYEYSRSQRLEKLPQLARSIRERQKDIRKDMKPLLDMLQLGPFTAEEALQSGIVDHCGYHQEILQTLINDGVKLWSLRKYCDANIVQNFFAQLDDSASYILQLLRKKGKKEGDKPNEKKGRVNFSLIIPDGNLEQASVNIDIMIPRTIGLIYLDNAIEGKGRFGGEATAGYILKAAKDPRFHSIVLRINSPGGDAVASETIWKAVMQAKTMKPVVASMGDVAASGGYYVAAAATTIFSNQNTITGSIGVISGWPVIKRLLDKVDITSDSIEPIPNAAWRHMELGLPESEMEKLRRHTDQMYESFKKVVSTGRGMSMEQVEDIAQGQVFTGSQAHELGLVNDLGGLTHAISWAIANAFPINTDNVRQFLDESTWDQVKDAQTGGEAWQEIVRKSIIASSGISDPDPETIRKIVKRCTIRCPPVVEIIVIPHTNPVGEALSVALSSAFQNDDERSPIPVDLPVINPGDPGDSSFNTFSSGRVIFGSLLGIALSNNIPLWQFPVFCSWYLAQAAGKMGTEGLGSGFLDNWLGKLLTDQNVFKATEQPRHVFAEKKTAWDVRMEMPPFQIFF